MSDVSGQVIFVDDDELLRVANKQSLRLAGFRVDAYSDARSALQHIDANFDGVIVSDIRMPEIDGLQFFRAVQEIDSDIPVILITGHGDVPMAVAALKAGVHDFLTKPFLADHLIATVKRACYLRTLLIDNRRLHLAAEEAARNSPFLGDMPAAVRLRASIEQIAAANVDVIVEGESGTGKELVATMLHRASRRRGSAFVAVDCSSSTAEIIEGDLFGYLLGGQSGSQTSQIEKAHRGTLFIHDADRLPLSAQSRLMQLLEDGVLRGRHSASGRPIEIKVIASCKYDLLQAVKEARFREDLFYRLNTAKILIPPLRDRKLDIPLLFSHFLNESLPKSGVAPEITDDVRRHLIDHSWPGNVRELKTFAIRFALGLIERADNVSAASSSLSDQTMLFEKSLICNVLRQCNGDVLTAIAQLQLPRKTFYDKLKRHRIDIAQFRVKL